MTGCIQVGTYIAAGLAVAIILSAVTTCYTAFLIVGFKMIDKMFGV